MPPSRSVRTRAAPGAPWLWPTSRPASWRGEFQSDGISERDNLYQRGLSLVEETQPSTRGNRQIRVVKGGERKPEWRDDPRSGREVLADNLYRPEEVWTASSAAEVQDVLAGPVCGGVLPADVRPEFRRAVDGRGASAARARGREMVCPSFLIASVPPQLSRINNCGNFSIPAVTSGRYAARFSSIRGPGLWIGKRVLGSFRQRSKRRQDSESQSGFWQPWLILLALRT